MVCLILMMCLHLIFAMCVNEDTSSKSNTSSLKHVGAFKPERGKTMGCKIARLKTLGAKSHNWQKIWGKSAIKPKIL